MTWREVWTVGVGYEPPLTHFSSVASAILTYLLTLLFCFIFHRLSRVFLPKFLQEYVLDFFKALAFCTYCFGHGVIRTAHGHLGYLLCVVPLNTASIFIFSLGDGTPLLVWLKYLQKQIPLWKFLLKVTAQILAGLCSWELGHLIFRLDFHESFADIVRQKASCSSDLNIAAVLGFLLECLGVAYDFWLDQQTLSKYVPVDIALKILNCAVLVCIGLNLTGMYLQPAMASGHTFGCGSTSVLSHIMVYWGGPFIGIYIGLKMGQVFHLPFFKTTRTSHTKQPMEVSQKGEETDEVAMKQLSMNGHNLKLRHRKKKMFFSNGNQK